MISIVPIYVAHFSLVPCVYIDLTAANITSAAVIRLNPPKVEVKWSHQGVPTRFEVVAKNSSTQQRKTVKDPHIRQAALELSHNTTYSLKVITIFGASTQLESEEMEIKTPSENEGLC